MIASDWTLNAADSVPKCTAQPSAKPLPTMVTWSFT